MQNGRHNAARDELFAQLRSKVPRDAKVWKEVSAGVQHEVRQRKYGSAGRDETVGGDVAVVTPKKRTMIDVVVRAYAQRCILSGSKLAVERAWDDKEVKRTRKDGVSGETTPFGMTNLGSVHVQSVKAIRTLVDRGHIGVVREKNDGQHIEQLAFDELLKQSQAAHARHAHIEQQATGLARLPRKAAGIQKLGKRIGARKRLAGQAT